MTHTLYPLHYMTAKFVRDKEHQAATALAKHLIDIFLYVFCQINCWIDEYDSLCIFSIWPNFTDLSVITLGVPINNWNSYVCFIFILSYKINVGPHMYLLRSTSSCHIFTMYPSTYNLANLENELNFSDMVSRLLTLIFAFEFHEYGSKFRYKFLILWRKDRYLFPLIHSYTLHGCSLLLYFIYFKHIYTGYNQSV